MLGRMIGLLVLGSSLLVAQIGSANFDGVDSRVEFPPLGCGSAATGEQAGCHFTDANPGVVVSIQGPSQIDVGQEGVGLYTVSIPAGTLGLEGAGMNAAIDAPNASDCELETFAPVGKQQLINDPDSLSPYPVVSHRDDGEAPPLSLYGVWSYQFLVLNCSAPGPILLRVAMNAFDGSGDEGGEAWNSNTLEITVPEPGATLLGVGLVATLAALRSHRS